MIIIYSIFRISVQQRLREYGKLEALGPEIRRIAVLLGAELMVLFLIAVPAGCFMGIILSKGIYVFYNREGTLCFQPEYLSVKPEDVVFSVMLLFLSLCLILYIVVRYLGKFTIMETIKGQERQRGRFRGRCSWSKKTDYMMLVVLMKYLRQSKGRVIIMLFMLSLGGTVFLTGSYVEGEISRNNKLTQETDNGTNADIQVQTETLTLQGVIPERAVGQMRNIPQVSLAEPVSS